MNSKVQTSMWKTISTLATLPVFFFFTVILFLFHDGWFFLPLLIFLIISTAIVYTVKWLFPTPRPDAKKLRPMGVFTLRNFWVYVDQGSFPSAHAARSAGLVTIAFFFPSLLLQLFAVVFFALACWSRVWLKRHSWRDIIGGALIGVAIGVLSWYLFPLFEGLFIASSTVMFVLG